MMINPAYITTNMQDLRLKQNNGLWYLEMGDSLFHVGAEFKESLYKTLNISRKTTGKIPLDEIFEAAKRHNSDPVKVYINKALALAVSLLKPTVRPIDPTQASELFEGTSEASEMHQTELQTEFYVRNPNIITVFDSKHGRYRAGGFVQIRHDRGTSIKIVPILEHTSSGQCAIINNKVLCLFVPIRKDANRTFADLKDAVKSVATSRKPEFRDILVDRIKESRNTVASVAECVHVASTLSEIAPERAKLLKLDRVFDHYGMAAPDEKSEKWLAMNPSHADRLQLFHLLVDTKTDDPNFREKAGSFLFDTGDLEGTDVMRLWGKSRRAAPRTEFDSDIVSDFETELESTEIYDDDDIASDFGD